MSDHDESGLAMAEERMLANIEAGLMAVRRKVFVDPLTAGESDRECLGCGDPIPPARLAAAPWAKRCVDCQGTVERH